METLVWIILIAIGWTTFGSFALSSIDKNLELTNWKFHAVWWLRFLVNVLWPVVAILYLTKSVRK